MFEKFGARERGEGALKARLKNDCDKIIAVRIIFDDIYFDVEDM